MSRRREEAENETGIAKHRLPLLIAIIAIVAITVCFLTIKD
jgi:hypothetical protein